MKETLNQGFSCWSGDTITAGVLISAAYQRRQILLRNKVQGSQIKLQGAGLVWPSCALNHVPFTLFRYCYLHFFIFYFFILYQVKCMICFYFFYSYKRKKVFHFNQPNIFFF